MIAIPAHPTSNHLYNLLDGFVDLTGLNYATHELSGLSLDSRSIKDNYLFLACAGSSQSQQHGVAYAGQAIMSGASVICWEPTTELVEMPHTCELENGQSVPLIKVANLHQKAGEIAARFYHEPSKKMKIVGVTGTNGKTSVSHFIAQLLSHCNTESNDKCAMIGTLGNGSYKNLTMATHTTPDAVTLQQLLSEYYNKAVETVVMEVSSHALSQYRVSGIDFDIAVFTNISRDHLDYHGDMVSYGEEKQKLFRFSSLTTVVLNADDPYSEVIAKSLAPQVKILRFSIQDRATEFYAENIKMTGKGLSFTLISGSKKYNLETRLFGAFNISNLLAAFAVANALGYRLAELVTAAEKLITVSGRMEQISCDDETEKPLVVVDYAHTPDALEKALVNLKTHCNGNLWCVFGCGGDRDRGKRPLMARIAEAHANKIIVTSDNPRTEPMAQITADISAGFSSVAKVIFEEDRSTAIRAAISAADTNDIILLAGKGHEDYQEINGRRVRFSDKEVARSVLCAPEEIN